MADLPQISSLATPTKEVEDIKKPRRFKYFNLPLIVVIALLSSYGLLVVYSAIHDNADYNFSRQVMGVGVGVVAMVILWRFDYRKLGDLVIPLIVINALLCISPLIPGIGEEVNGGQSWIKIAGIQIQPGEFAKVTVILLAASFVARYGGKIDTPREYIKAAFIIILPFFFIMLQPDLGTGLVYLFIAGTVLIIGGAKARYILITAAILAAGIVGIFTIDPILDDMMGKDVLLKEYQKGRLLVFIDPSYAETDSGWNLKQAKVAIGSGGFFGKGFMQGTQSSFGFLPESATDFIFCVLAEEFGFFGVLILLVLYLALIAICFRIAGSAGDLFGTLIVMGVVGMWLFHILENIGMTCGLMPITGIPLPFVSSGSSFMLVNFVLLGLVGSVWAHNER